MSIRVRIEIDDPDGTVRQIGLLTLLTVGDETDVGTYRYSLDEGPHPLVAPLLARGVVQDHPRRQSAWRLVHAAVSKALKERATH